MSNLNDVNADAIEELVNQMMTPEMVRVWKEYLNSISQEEATELRTSAEEMYRVMREELK